MSLIEQLAYIYELTVNGQLDSFLAELGVPEFEDTPESSEPRKFRSRPEFDRSTFDIEAYTLEIEREFKK